MYSEVTSESEVCFGHLLSFPIGGDQKISPVSLAFKKFREIEEVALSIFCPSAEKSPIFEGI